MSREINKRGVFMKHVEFNNGNSMPAMGMGFYKVKSEECKNIIFSAIESGYRSFDTANAYFNEVAIGKAIGECGVKKMKFTLQQSYRHRITA